MIITKTTYTTEPIDFAAEVDDAVNRFIEANSSAFSSLLDRLTARVDPNWVQTNVDALGRAGLADALKAVLRAVVNRVDGVGAGYLIHEAAAVPDDSLTQTVSSEGQVSWVAESLHRSVTWNATIEVQQTRWTEFATTAFAAAEGWIPGLQPGRELGYQESPYSWQMMANYCPWFSSAGLAVPYLTLEDVSATLRDVFYRVLIKRLDLQQEQTVTFVRRYRFVPTGVTPPSSRVPRGTDNPWISVGGEWRLYASGLVGDITIPPYSYTTCSTKRKWYGKKKKTYTTVTLTWDSEIAALLDSYQPLPKVEVHDGKDLLLRDTQVLRARLEIDQGASRTNMQAFTMVSTPTMDELMIPLCAVRQGRLRVSMNFKPIVLKGYAFVMNNCLVTMSEDAVVEVPSPPIGYH